MIEKVLDLPEGFLTDYQPKIQPGIVKGALAWGWKVALSSVCL